MSPRNKKQVLFGFVMVFFALPIVVALLFYSFTKPTQPSITETVDPTTGEATINAPTLPENLASGNGTTVLGATNIADLYGNNLVYDTLRNQYLVRNFSDQSVIKISQKGIEKKVTIDQQTGRATINVTFNVYLGEDTKTKYIVATSFSPEDEILSISTTSPNGKQGPIQINTNGGD